MSFPSRVRRLVMVLAIASFVAEAPAQDVRNDPRGEESKLLEDAAVIARLLYARYATATGDTVETAGSVALLRNGGGLSEDAERRIQRSGFGRFVCSKEFPGANPFVSLRCARKRGDIVIVKFDRAGKIVSCETDRNPSAGHYATGDYVDLFYIASHLRSGKPRMGFDSMIEQELVIGDRPAPGSAPFDASPIPVRAGKREGDFFISRKNKTPWCRGRFVADQPAGEWQLFAPDGKPSERWKFLGRKIEKIPKAESRLFDEKGDLGTRDFAVTLIQGSYPGASGPPRTYVRVSASGQCETEFGPWKARFRLTDDMQRELRELLGSIDLFSLKDHYDNPHVHDGGWMKISLRANGKTKTVRYSNWYPRPIRDLADYFARDVLPQFPMEFLGSVNIGWDAKEEQIFLDDES